LIKNRDTNKIFDEMSIYLNQLVQETQITETFGTFISWFN